MKAKIRKIMKGFNTVELAVIISVAALLLVFVLPNFLRTSITGNETAALTNLYKLATAFETYRTLYGTYPTTFSQLRATRPALIDEKLALGQKQGYDFRISTEADIVPTYAFRIFADPSQPGKTGVRYFKIGSSTSEANGVAYYALTPPTDWAPIGISPGGTSGHGDPGDDCPRPPCDPPSNPCQGLCCSSCNGTGCVSSVPPCPGGTRQSTCPYLLVRTAKGFIQDNDIIPGGEGNEYTDYYLITKPVRPSEKGIIELKIAELLDEQSYLDHVGLLEVIHPRGVKIAPTPDGSALTYNEKGLMKPLKIIDAQGKDILSLASTKGNGYYHGKKGDFLIFDFGKVDKTANGMRIVSSSDLKEAYAVVDEEQRSCYSLHVQVLLNNKRWQEVGVVHPHESWDIWAIDLTKYEARITGDLKIKFIWTKEHKLDFCLLDTSRQEPIKIQRLAFTGAYSAKAKDALLMLNSSDNKYLKLNKGDEVILNFASEAKVRGRKDVKDYIFISEGFFKR